MASFRAGHRRGFLLPVNRACYPDVGGNKESSEGSCLKTVQRGLDFISLCAELCSNFFCVKEITVKSVSKTAVCKGEFNLPIKQG